MKYRFYIYYKTMMLF